MSNYLKKFLFSVVILMMPYMNSVSKAMDPEDYEESTVRVHSTSLMTDDQKDVSSSVKNSTSSQVESLEDSTISWSSYLISTVKDTFQTTNEFINLATHNPKLAMLVGFTYILPIVSALDANNSVTCIIQGNPPKVWYPRGCYDKWGCLSACSGGSLYDCSPPCPK